MKHWSRNGVIGSLVCSWLSLAATANAGPYVNLMQPCDCPPTHYSIFHVLTPFVWRWAAWCQGPCRYTFAKNKFPGIPPTPYKVRYHCPSMNPLQFSLENYLGLDGNPPMSTYPTPPTAPSPSRQGPLEELPPPREEKKQPPEKLPPPTEERKK